MRNTRDFRDFGTREISMAAELLNAYCTQRDNTNIFAKHAGFAIEFNPMSAMVFLVDEDYNVAVMEGDYLVDFLTCGDCGHEGTPDEFKKEMSEECCKEMFNDYTGAE